MLLVSTADVFGHMWRLHFGVWLFNAYAALDALPCACLGPVRETSRADYSLIHFLPMPYKSQTRELLYVLIIIVFLTSYTFLFCFHQQGHWWRTIKVSQNQIKGIKQTQQNSMQNAYYSTELAALQGALQNWLRQRRAYWWKVCICSDQLGLNVWDCHNLQYIISKLLSTDYLSYAFTVLYMENTIF